MSKIKGVVAAGHKATAQAGKQILEAGGNAIDAAIASAFAGCVADPLLTGLGAGGYMLVYDAKSNTQDLFDFAVVVPGEGAKKPDEIKMTPVTVDFGSASQIFMVLSVFQGLCQDSVRPIKNMAQCRLASLSSRRRKLLKKE
jgi:gamma-glutamyltranspeptidase/glutathione hydrolase